jgi:hypothetical protein
MSGLNQSKPNNQEGLRFTTKAASELICHYQGFFIEAVDTNE